MGSNYETSTPIRTVIAMDFDNDGNQELFMNNIDYRSRGAPNSVHSVINSPNVSSYLSFHIKNFLLYKYSSHIVLLLQGNSPIIQGLDVGDAIEINGHGTGGAVADMDGDGQVELLLSHGESASEPLTLYDVTEGHNNNYIRYF